MNDNEIKKYKTALMKEYWVEDRHHKLKKLHSRDAKKIIESMNESEIYQNVNIRKHQEDYIADYLEYLWDISETGFWNHVKISLDFSKSILWSDNMFYFEKMCNVKIPNDVLKAVLDFIIYNENSSKMDLEAIGCVVKAQAEKFGRLDEIENYISLLSDNNKNIASKKIKAMLNNKCPYLFY